MKHVLKTTGIWLAAAIALTGCQGNSEKYAFRDTGIEQLNAGNYGEAIQAFDEALGESDGLVGAFELDVLKYRAEAEYKVEDYGAAAHTYEILSQVDEPRPEYVMMQNMLYIKAGELDKALAAYQAAYGPEAAGAEDKGSEDGKSGEDDQSKDGDKSDKKGDKKNSEKTHAAQESDSASQLTILLSLGQALAEAERFDEARALYQQAIEAGMQSDELYNRMGLCELEAGNLDQAMSYFETGMEMPDGGAKQKILFNQAAVYEQKQDFARALDLFETYVAAYGTTPELEKEITFLKSRQQENGNETE